MTLTTTAFMGMLFFQFVGCQLNTFIVNSQFCPINDNVCIDTRYIQAFQFHHK